MGEFLKKAFEDMAESAKARTEAANARYDAAKKK